MKLKELIEKLIAAELRFGDVDVDTEGCDCDGDVGYVVADKDGVHLVRSDGWYARHLSKE